MVLVWAGNTERSRLCIQTIRDRCRPIPADFIGYGCGAADLHEKMHHPAFGRGLPVFMEKRQHPPRWRHARAQKLHSLGRSAGHLWGFM